MVDVQHTVPAPLNYAPPGLRPFRSRICTSANHQVCHGVPGDRLLKLGISSHRRDGHQGRLSRRCSRMFLVKAGIRAPAEEVTYGACDRHPPGAAAQPWRCRRAIQQPRRKHGYSVVRESAATASAASSMRNRRSALRQARRPGAVGAGHDLHHEPMIMPASRQSASWRRWTIVNQDTACRRNGSTACW